MSEALERMLTGIPGLDHLLEGGLLRGNSLLIEGPPGSGKSTFGVRILHEGVIRYKEPGLLITFEEFPKQVYAEAMSYGVDLAPHGGCRQITCHLDNTTAHSGGLHWQERPD